MYYMLEVSPEEMNTIEQALKDAIKYLDDKFKFNNNFNKNYCPYSYCMYERYTKYKKMIEEIENKKGKKIIYGKNNTEI